MSKLKTNQFTLPSGQIITERPILFQTDMVKAILEDRKTQTRRTVKPQPNEKTIFAGKYGGIPAVGDYVAWLNADTDEEADRILKQFKFCPYGQPGDLLWVRETWRKSEFPQHDGLFEYRASMENPDALWNKGIWKPSIHMPKSAARIWLMIEDIEVERLHDIDGFASGLEGVEGHWWESTVNCSYKNYQTNKFTENARRSFISLWISINGLESWHANPWVWVIKFRVLSKTGRPSMEQIAEEYQDVVNQKSKIINREGVSNG